MPDERADAAGRYDDNVDVVDPLTLRNGYGRRAEPAERIDRGSRLRGWNPGRPHPPTPAPTGPPPQPIMQPLPPFPPPFMQAPPLAPTQASPPGQGGTVYAALPPEQANGYGTGAYPANGSASNGGPVNGVTPNGYPATPYPTNGYPPDGYPQNGYPQNGYGQNGYPPDGYAQNGYPQNGQPAGGPPSGSLPIPQSYLPSQTPFSAPPGVAGPTGMPPGVQRGYAPNMPTTGFVQPPSAPQAPVRIEPYQTGLGWVGVPDEALDRPYSAPGGDSVAPLSVAPRSAVPRSATPAVEAFEGRLDDGAPDLENGESPTGAYGPGPRQIGHPRPARVAEFTGANAAVRVQSVDRFDDDEDTEEAEPAVGNGYVAAAAATLGWYAVPAVLYIAYAFYLGGAARPGCVSANGGQCPSPRAEALHVISSNIGLIAVAIVLSTVIAVMLRWATSGWRTLAIGFASAVVGGGATTVLITTFNGG